MYEGRANVNLGPADHGDHPRALVTSTLNVFMCAWINTYWFKEAWNMLIQLKQAKKKKKEIFFERKNMLFFKRHKALNTVFESIRW